jgi:O-antigen/teichoic acid export membrane protein
LRKIVLTRGWRESREAVRRMWRFPAISAPMALLDTLALAMPLLVIASSFGDQAAGNYAQVQRLIGAPLVLVATAGGQVFLKYAGDRFRAAESVMPLIRRFVLYMAGLAVLVLIAVALVGQPLLRMLIGNQWRTDTGFLVLALLPVICRVIGSPVSSVLILTHRLTALATWQICYFVTTAATLFAGARWLDFEGLLAALAINEFLLYGAYLSLSIHSARQAVGEAAGSPAPSC